MLFKEPEAITSEKVSEVIAFEKMEE